jgi:hypothetical protein
MLCSLLYCLPVLRIVYIYIYIYIVTCFLGSKPIQRFVARQQLCKYATIMQALLGSRSLLTMGIQLEGVLYVVRAEAISHRVSSSSISSV